MKKKWTRADRRRLQAIARRAARRSARKAYGIILAERRAAKEYLGSRWVACPHGIYKHKPCRECAL